jgi:hypothetical protein
MGRAPLESRRRVMLPTPSGEQRTQAHVRRVREVQHGLPQQAQPCPRPTNCFGRVPGGSHREGTVERGPMRQPERSMFGDRKIEIVALTAFYTGMLGGPKA